MDLLHYDLHLRLTSLSNQLLQGKATVIFQATQPNVSQISLQLLQLQVDSVKRGAQSLPYSYNDTTITITLLKSLSTNEQDTVTIFYQGTPKKDPAFGGFYFGPGNFAYNIGVGMSLVPHALGRVWFPAIDTFTERATYTFHVTVDSSNEAICNGTLDSVTFGPSTKTYHWSLRDPIPSYLASVAVSDYIAIRDTFTGLLGPVPSAIYVPPADSTNAVGSFQHLKQMFGIFEGLFGPYRWERVGYVGVPFMAGAMEHATNIAYPLIVINGTLTYETLIAHELSHHWFGNLATCASASEMWLNEGFASYCESLFLEGHYGRKAYLDYVRKNHSKVLRRTHVMDGGYYPLTPIPQDKTYGSTVYNKGATILHYLRHYIGDSAFFAGLQNYLNSHQFSHVTTDTLQHYLEQASGENLSDFFQGWVKTAGFPAFLIDSIDFKQLGAFYAIDLAFTQALKGSNSLRNRNRLPIHVLRNNGSWETYWIEVNGATYHDTLWVNFQPQLVLYDKDGLVSDAKTTHTLLIDSTTTYGFDQGFLNVTITSLIDSFYLQTLHYFVPPIGSPPAGNYQLSSERYWHVDGNIPQGTKGTMTFFYNGTTNPNLGYLDINLLQGQVEDSLVLLYRRNVGAPWQLIPQTLLTGASKTDKIGSIRIDTILTGDFCLALKVTPTHSITSSYRDAIEIYPNPVDSHLHISFPQSCSGLLSIFSLNGQELLCTELHNAHDVDLNLSFLPSGTYKLVFKQGNKITSLSTIIKH